jgi:hypothetical protein
MIFYQAPVRSNFSVVKLLPRYPFPQYYFSGLVILHRGVADSDNSGFNGPGGWGPGRNQLNNNYYTELLDNGRVNVDFALELQDNSNNPPFPNQFMWKLNGRRGGTFMFHADMALAIDMQGHLVDTTSGAINCTLVSGTATTCPPSPLLSIAVEYANNNNVWVNDFHDAFVKMVHSGCGNGVCQAV